jgi:hypothetical protein
MKSIVVKNALLVCYYALLGLFFYGLLSVILLGAQSCDNRNIRLRSPVLHEIAAATAELEMLISQRCSNNQLVFEHLKRAETATWKISGQLIVKEEHMAKGRTEAFAALARSRELCLSTGTGTGTGN